MEVRQVGRKLEAEHGVVFALGDDFFGYFGWPSVGRMEDGTLVAVASGLRSEHVCPFGRTVFCISRDDGSSWTSPRVINDSPLDDRDAGVVPLGGKKMLVSWFTSDNTDSNRERLEAAGDTGTLEAWTPGFAWATPENVARWVGSWVRITEDGGDTWGPWIPVAVSTPHGPVRLANGDLLYFGKDFRTPGANVSRGVGDILAVSSTDGGRTWEEIGQVPLPEGTHQRQYHEPHVVELPSGKLIGHIRLEDAADVPKLERLGIVTFSIAQSVSEDGGRTWSEAEPMNFHGSPPHLIRHSCGALVCIYGCRLEPYGQRVAISTDEGASWDYDYILRDDGPDWDLGYPSSVELADGSIFSLYYQKVKAGDRCGLLWSRWRLPC